MDPAEIAALHRKTRDFHETYLNAARDFAECGLYEEAVAFLEEYPGDKPMIHYYKALYLHLLGREEECGKALCAAEVSDPTCCFPNKLEDIAALSFAVQNNSKGAKAYYYLGCLFYDRLQFDRSIELWEKSEALDDSYPTLLRNLAIAYYWRNMRRLRIIMPFFWIVRLFWKKGYGIRR